MHVQAPSKAKSKPKPNVASHFDQLFAKELGGRRGLDAYLALLLAHATLVRELGTALEARTGLPLADFDVLAHIALAGGELRMTDLAARVLISRSGMTRRVSQLLDAGLVRRSTTGSDARVVVITLTDAGFARLMQATPVHAAGIRQFFAAKLTDEELSVLERVFAKLSVDGHFG